MIAKSQMIRFPASHDALLAARLDLRSETPRAYTLFAHCFTCSKDTLAAARISRALTLRGIAVLRFDFTGLGGREGEFANTNFSSNVVDLVAAAKWLRETQAAPKLLIGHSLGGAAVLAAAHAMPEATASDHHRCARRTRARVPAFGARYLGYPTERPNAAAAPLEQGSNNWLESHRASA